VSTSDFRHSRDFEDAVPGRGGGAEDAVVERLDAPFAIDLEALEEQQRRVLALLERADGAAVSFAELRDVGVEFPASVVSELELVGVPIQRCSEGGGRQRRAAGVRLVPTREPRSTSQRAVVAAPGGAVAGNGSPTTAAPSIPPAPSRAGGPQRSPRFRDRPRRLNVSRLGRPPIVLVAGVVATIAAVLLAIALAGGSPHRHPARSVAGAPATPRRAGTHATPSRGSAPATPSRARTHGAPARASLPATNRSSRPVSSSPPKRHHVAANAKPAPPTAPSPGPATPVSPALAAQLEAQGHTLLAAGSYADAATVLRRSLAASGERLAACLQPLTLACLTYAYALYDLGRALALGDDPQAAVAILEDRLEIDNQRPVVATELRLAQVKAHATKTSAAQ
jgi:hypothetical protein